MSARSTYAAGLPCSTRGWIRLTRINCASDLQTGRSCAPSRRWQRYMLYLSAVSAIGRFVLGEFLQSSWPMKLRLSKGESADERAAHAEEIVAGVLPSDQKEVGIS